MARRVSSARWLARRSAFMLFAMSTFH